MGVLTKVVRLDPWAKRESMTYREDFIDRKAGASSISARKDYALYVPGLVKIVRESMASSVQELLKKVDEHWDEVNGKYSALIAIQEMAR